MQQQPRREPREKKITYRTASDGTKRSSFPKLNCFWDRFFDCRCWLSGRSFLNRIRSRVCLFFRRNGRGWRRRFHFLRTTAWMVDKDTRQPLRLCWKFLILLFLIFLKISLELFLLSNLTGSNRENSNLTDFDWSEIQTPPPGVNHTLRGEAHCYLTKYRWKFGNVLIGSLVRILNYDWCKTFCCNF